jgi:hypothetical protein
VREENPSGSSTRVLTLVTSAHAQPSISSYGPATSALHVLKGQAASTASVNNGQLLLDLQLSSTAAASHCPLFDLQIASAAVSPPGDKQTQASGTGRKATSDHEDSTGTGSLNLVKNRDALVVKHYETQVPVLGIKSTRQRNNNQSKYHCIFIYVSCDVRCDVPSSYFNYALFFLDDELGEWSFVELAQYSSLLAAAYNIIHNKQVPIQFLVCETITGAIIFVFFPDFWLLKQVDVLREMLELELRIQIGCLDFFCSVSKFGPGTAYSF